MGKEERKARRQKNRERRQTRKRLRKEKFEEFLVEINKTPELPEETPSYEEKFNEYWPAAKAALQFIELSKITGRKLDEKIRVVVALGDDVAKNPGANSKFRDKLKKIWKYVRIVLIGVTVFATDKEADEKIDKVIEIGDWLSGIAE